MIWKYVFAKRFLLNPPQLINQQLIKGGSSGLVVMGDDSCMKVRGFRSWRCILDGHFFTSICCKNCNVCLKRPKINGKEAGIGPFFLKKKY